MSTEQLFQLVLNHPLAAKIQCMFFNKSYLSNIIVIEIDLPWDARQVEEFGPNFLPWNEKKFRQLTNTLSTNLSTIAYTFAVANHFILILVLDLSFEGAGFFCEEMVERFALY